MMMMVVVVMAEVVVVVVVIVVTVSFCSTVTKQCSDMSQRIPVKRAHKHVIHSVHRANLK